MSPRNEVPDVLALSHVQKISVIPWKEDMNESQRWALKWMKRRRNTNRD